jgi:fructose-1,6-bisphosphatase I
MAMICEAAGGMASTGLFNGNICRMMALEPKDVHERCPVILGCPRDVNIVLDFYAKAKAAGTI